MSKNVLMFVALCATLSLCAQEKAPTSKSDHPAIQTANAPSVTTSKPVVQEPPMSEQSSVTSSRWYSDSAWWLVIVGTLTAGAIGWQSYETRKAAQASRDSITLFRSKEKARLEFRVRREQWIRSFGEHLESPAVEFQVINYGPTHAFNIRVLVSYILTESDRPQFLPDPHEISARNILKAGDDSLPSVTLDIGNDLDGLGALLGGTKFLQLGGMVTYTDVFGEEAELRFRYICKKVDSRYSWTEQGLPTENAAT